MVSNHSSTYLGLGPRVVKAWSGSFLVAAGWQVASCHFAFGGTRCLVIQICLLRIPRIRLHLPSCFYGSHGAYVQNQASRYRTDTRHYTNLLSVNAMPKNVDCDEMLDRRTSTSQDPLHKFYENCVLRLGM